MRSALAFAAGILVGFLLAWAVGPAMKRVAPDWPAVARTVVSDSVHSGLEALHGGFAAILRPSEQRSSPSILRRPVTRSVRMASSGLIIALPVAGLPGTSAPGGVLAAPDTSVAFILPSPEPSLTVTPSRAAPDAEPAASDARPEGSKKTARAGTAAQDYARALGNYDKGQHALAREEFAAFMTAFPGHPLVPNALYWSGETWYAQARYDRAAEFFARVVQDHPRHAKSPDALLKLAYSALRQGQPEQAGIYLRQLEARYPHSPASRLGRQAQSRLQGHNGSAGRVPARG